MLVDSNTADKAESQRIFVNTDQVLVALADSDGLFIGVNLYLPRCQYIRSTTISQKRGFVFALLMGVIIGTFSSLFVASPIAYDIQRAIANRKANKAAK